MMELGSTCIINVDQSSEDPLCLKSSPDAKHKYPCLLQPPGRAGSYPSTLLVDTYALQVLACNEGSLGDQLPLVFALKTRSLSSFY